MTRTRPFLLAAAFALLPWLAGHAAAQKTAQGGPAGVGRAFRGLFGADRQRSTGKQALDFRAWVYGGYDDNVSGVVGRPVDPRLTVASWLSGAGAGLVYSRRLSQSASMGANLFTNGAYLFSQDQFAWYGTNGSVGVGIGVGRYGSLTVSQAVSYRPDYAFDAQQISSDSEPDVGIEEPLQPEYVLAGRASWNYLTSLRYRLRVTERMLVSADYRLRYHNFSDATEVDLLEQWAGARVSYRFWRFLSAFASCYYRSGTYLDPLGEDRTVSDQSCDAGLGAGYGYAKRWQYEIEIGPRTSLSFSLGAGFTTGISTSNLEPRLRVHALGSALFSHYFNDRWRFQSGYDRRIGFFDWTFDPWMTEVAYATLGGQLNRRVSVYARSAYSWGSQIGGAGTYDTWTNTAGIQAALTPNIAAFARYVRYNYLYQGVVLPGGLPPEFDRQAFRFGLAFWVPLLR